jgi:hypothetical protein
MRPAKWRILFFTCTAVCLLAAGRPAGAQTPPQTTPPQTTPPQTGADIPRLRVFLDCGDCYAEYLRDQIDWVDFVRQPQDADVHLLSTSKGTGGGGNEIVLRFVGKLRFQGVDQDLRVLSVTSDTEELRRRRVLRTVIIGLASYLARDGRAGDLGVSVRTAETPVATGVTAARDPWNKWFFTLRGGGSVNAEETTREWDVEFRASADRVTDQWILSFGAEHSENREEFDLDEDEPLRAVRRNRQFDWFTAKSWGPHWSFGFMGSSGSSTFENDRFRLEAGPAVEYSIFPYEEYASRRFVVQYTVAGIHARYNELTIFDKLRETLSGHEISSELEQEQPWGSLQVGAQFSQYFHDLSKYRFEVDGELSFRIARGISLDVEGSASRVRDQISLPKRDATDEEVLLRIRELQSGFELSFSASLTYSFGSLFNNIVNPRFGR